jgi:hypothetical protein
MEVRQNRSPALWALDPISFETAADTATADGSTKIGLLKQFVARPPRPKPRSQFAEMLAEIW